VTYPVFIFVGLLVNSVFVFCKDNGQISLENSKVIINDMLFSSSMFIHFSFIFNDIRDRKSKKTFSVLNMDAVCPSQTLVSASPHGVAVRKTSRTPPPP
jgi:hypothetical protein